MQQIKNATVYAADLPNAEQLAEQLSQLLFKPILSTHISSTGFVANDITRQLVTAIPGGFSFTIRRDEKIIPQDEINKACNIRLKAIEQLQQRKPTKAEKEAIRDGVIADLATKAFSKTKLVRCYYHETDKRLYVDTVSPSLAGICIGVLVHTIGKLQTHTLHVSDLRHGLTTRLKSYIDETQETKGQAFGNLIVGDEVFLKRDAGGDEFAAKKVDVQVSREIREALENGCQVTAIRFEDGAMSVRLTQDFKLQSIKWTEPEPLETDEVPDPVNDWITEAGMQLSVLNGFTTSMLGMFEVEPETDDGPGEEDGPWSEGWDERSAEADGEQVTAEE